MNLLWCLCFGDVQRYAIDVSGACSDIERAFLQERHLLPVSADEIRKSFAKDLSIMGFTISRELVCHTRLIHLVGTWFELASTYVRPAFRERGINHEMYQRFLAKHEEKDILATTTNPISRDVGRGLGFVEIQRKALPQEVWRASCTCSAEKTGTTNNDGCKIAFGESSLGCGLCYFRITQATALRHRKLFLESCTVGR